MLFGKVIDKWIASTDAKPGSIKVLDAGCGDGINGSVLKKLLSERVVNCDIIGCDYNSLRVERARSQGYERIVQADLLQLPVEDNDFDLVLCSHVLEHIPQDEACLRELKRVLKPNGLLILAVPNEGCFIATLRNRFIQRSILHTTDHVNFYTDKKFTSIIQQVGLKPITKVMRHGNFMPHLRLDLLLREYSWGRKLLDLIRMCIPSQCGGLVFGLTKIE